MSTPSAKLLRVSMWFRAQALAVCNEFWNGCNLLRITQPCALATPTSLCTTDGPDGEHCRTCSEDTEMKKSEGRRGTVTPCDGDFWGLGDDQ